MNFSIMLDKNKCIGCTYCMKRCPTEAIRLVNGKAVINNSKCIHCGECIKVCPHDAYTPESIEWQEELNYSGFKYKIAIPTATLYGQFPKGVDICKIQNSLLKLGYDYVYDLSWAAEIVAKAIKRKIAEEKHIRPLISTYCPAAVRLIKIKYPSLMDNLIKIKEPMVIAATLARESVKKKYNLKDEEIGVFHITPCPAKLLSVTDPIGDYCSAIDWVVPLNTIYGDLYKEIKKEDNNSCVYPSLKGMKWAVAGGHSESIELTNYLAVHGVENVIAILDEIENGRLNGVDYIEVLSCVQGCVGGSFNVENPFIASSNINYIINNLEDLCLNEDLEKFEEMYKSRTFDFHIKEEIPEQQNLKEAIQKKEKIEEILRHLPGIDCGSCGSPTCYLHAEEVFYEKSTIEDCLVLKAQKKR